MEMRNTDAPVGTEELAHMEIVHFQRFGEGLRIVQDKLDFKNFYAINPAFMADKAR